MRVSKIKGVTVQLVEKVSRGHDEFNHPIYEDYYINVENVLIYPTSSNDVTNDTDLRGRMGTYTLAIPKGDSHEWENKEVIFFGRRWKTIGIPEEGIEELIPLDWNKKVFVERYE